MINKEYPEDKPKESLLNYDIIPYLSKQPKIFKLLSSRIKAFSETFKTCCNNVNELIVHFDTLQQNNQNNQYSQLKNFIENSFQSLLSLHKTVIILKNSISENLNQLKNELQRVSNLTESFSKSSQTFIKLNGIFNKIERKFKHLELLFRIVSCSIEQEKPLFNRCKKNMETFRERIRIIEQESVRFFDFRSSTDQLSQTTVVESDLKENKDPVSSTSRPSQSFVSSIPRSSQSTFELPTSQENRSLISQKFLTVESM